MSLHELVEQLQSENFTSQNYYIEGIDGAFWHDNTFYMVKSDGGWEVGHYERGKRDPYSHWTDEASAGRALLALLRQSIVPMVRKR